MDLTLEEVARLLNVPQELVLQWSHEGKIPAYALDGEYRFNPIQIEAWLFEHGLEENSLSAASSTEWAGIHKFSLYRAIHKGEVYSSIQGQTKEEVIRRTMHQFAGHFELDGEVLTELLLDREQLMPTALNSGVAVPHTRDFLLNQHFDVVFVVFPQAPIDYGALDGKPVHTMFFLAACQHTRHLELLAKIAHFCHSEENLALLATKPNKATLLSHIKTWEAHLYSPRKSHELVTT